MAVAQVSSSSSFRSLSIAGRGVPASIAPLSIPNFLPLPSSNFLGSASSLRLLSNNSQVMHGTSHQKTSRRALTVRAEQSSKGGSSFDVWLGRIAMIGFAVAITIEVSTGKGLLENFGLTSPLPTVALAVTALVGALTAFLIFQSASDN